MKPVYRNYCTEPQRRLWKKVEAMPGFRSFETGCLLAAAEDVPDTTARLDEIGEKCRPWHHLFAPEILMQREQEAVPIDGGEFVTYVSTSQPPVPRVGGVEWNMPPDDSGWSHPSSKT